MLQTLMSKEFTEDLEHCSLKTKRKEESVFLTEYSLNESVQLPESDFRPFEKNIYHFRESIHNIQSQKPIEFRDERYDSCNEGSTSSALAAH